MKFVGPISLLYPRYMLHIAATQHHIPRPNSALLVMFCRNCFYSCFYFALYILDVSISLNFFIVALNLSHQTCTFTKTPYSLGKIFTSLLQGLHATSPLVDLHPPSQRKALKINNVYHELLSTFLK